MSYTDLRDFSPEYSITVTAFDTDTDVYVIQVEKLGGGTPGRAYRGDWRVIVTCNGEEVLRTQELTSGTAITHKDAAALAVESVTDSIGAYDLSFPVEEKHVGEDGEWVISTQ